MPQAWNRLADSSSVKFDSQHCREEGGGGGRRREVEGGGEEEGRGRK